MRTLTFSALALVASLACACSGSSSNTTSPLVSATTSSSSGTTYTGLAFSLSTTSLSQGQTISLSATGGTSPYFFYIQNGSELTNYAVNMGTVNDINLSNPTYTAPNTTASVTLVVLDSDGDEATTTVTVGTGSVGTSSSGSGGSLLISPTSGTYVEGQAITLTTTGGVPPYTYSISGGGGGSFTGQSTNQVIFNAPSYTGSVAIQVTDSQNLAATSTLTFTTVSGLTLTPGKASVGTGQTLAFQALGGTGPYTYSSVTGFGSFTGNTYYAPAVPGSATIKVTDQGTGNSTTTTLTVNATYSTSQISSSFEIDVGRYLAITYDFNSSATTPSIEVFGVGNNADASSIGYDPNGYAICYGAVSPCVQNIPLTNYVVGVPATYRGTIEIRTDKASETVAYCISSDNLQAAHLNQVTSGGTQGQFYKQVAFTDPTHNGMNTLFGGDLTETFFTYFNGSSHVADQTVIDFTGGYTYNTDCSDYPTGSSTVDVAD